jgi:hypothetical protein
MVCDTLTTAHHEVRKQTRGWSSTQNEAQAKNVLFLQSHPHSISKLFDYQQTIDVDV